MRVHAGIMPFYTIPLRKQVIITEQLIIPGYRKNASNSFMSSPDARKISGSRLSREAAGQSNSIYALASFAGAPPLETPGKGVRFSGTSAAMTSFSLEGIPVPAMQHASLVSNPGGAGSLLPADAVQHATLYQGAPPVSLGTAPSGLVALTLQDGNYREARFRLDVGSHEAGMRYSGPLFSGRSALRLGYRHGTARFFQKTGWLGSKAPYWQDAHLKFTSLTQSGGKISVLAAGGQNRFSGSRSPAFTPAYAVSDLFHSGYQQNLNGVGGISYRHPVNRRKLVSATLYSTVSQVQLHGDSLTPENRRVKLFGEFCSETRYGAKATFRYKKNVHNTFLVGGRFAFSRLGLQDSLRLENTYRKSAAVTAGYWYAQAFGAWQYRLDDAISMYLGINARYVHFHKQFRIAPRAWASWKVTPQQTFTLKLGQQFWLNHPLRRFHETEYLPGMYLPMNEELPLARVYNGSLLYDLLFSRDLQLRARLWFQHFGQLQAPAYPKNHAPFVSPQNPHYVLFDTLKARGELKSQGVALSLVHFGSQKLHYRFEAGWNHSVYNAYDRKIRENPMGNRLSFVFSAGYRHKTGKGLLWEGNLTGRVFQQAPSVFADRQLSGHTAAPYQVFGTLNPGFDQWGALLDASLQVNYNQKRLSHTLLLEARQMYLQDMQWQGRGSDAQLPFYPSVTYRMGF